MVELVTRNYWWPGVTRDVGKYVEGCDLCQRIKNGMEEPVGKLKLREVPEKPWMSRSKKVDLIYFIFLFIFIFISFYFLFSIFRTTRIRADRSRCHISHNLMA